MSTIKPLTCSVAKGYLSQILANAAVKRYVTAHQPEVLEEFQRLVDMVALESVPAPKPDAEPSPETDSAEAATDAAAMPSAA